MRNTDTFAQRTLLTFAISLTAALGCSSCSGHTGSGNSAPAVPPSAAGHWLGTYEGNTPSVRVCELHLTQTGSEVSGTIAFHNWIDQAFGEVFTIDHATMDANGQIVGDVIVGQPDPGATSFMSIVIDPDFSGQGQRNGSVSYKFHGAAGNTVWGHQPFHVARQPVDAQPEATGPAFIVESWSRPGMRIVQVTRIR